MYKYLLICLSVLLLACNSPRHDLSTVQKLHVTAKVWGFLKYYHPRVNEDTVNWDQQLVGMISKLDQVKTDEELSDLYV